MHWAIAICVVAVLSVVSTLIYFALRRSRGKNERESEGIGEDFRPRIGFSRQDAFQSVAVILDNQSDDFVWAEEVEIALTNLKAREQTAEPSHHEICKIRQNIRSQDLLPISLVETIYNAAGRPQRKYSCVLSSVVRYRIGDAWFEKPMKTYKLEMAGLTVASIRRDRKTQYQFKPRDKSEELHAMDITSK